MATQTVDRKKVPPRVWYYLLDWKDSNQDRLMKMYGTHSFSELSTSDFWALFQIVTEEDNPTSIRIIDHLNLIT